MGLRSGFSLTDNWRFSSNPFTSALSGYLRATIADAVQLLTHRYGLEQSHAHKALGAIAAHHGVSLHGLTTQLAAKVDQPSSAQGACAPPVSEA